MVHRLHPGRGQVHLKLRTSCRRASGRLEGAAVGGRGAAWVPARGAPGPVGRPGAVRELRAVVGQVCQGTRRGLGDKEKCCKVLPESALLD